MTRVGESTARNIGPEATKPPPLTMSGANRERPTPGYDRLEIRTAAGPSSAVQCVFNGGPYTTASHVRQCQLVCPPPP